MRRGRRKRGGAVKGGQALPTEAAVAVAPVVPVARAALIVWAGLMRAGIADLGLRPCEFWALTPFELRIMLGLETAARPLSRARLEELAARFPDRMKGREDG